MVKRAAADLCAAGERGPPQWRSVWPGSSERGCQRWTSQSIANAERCIARAPEGSCERRSARLQAVFAWCEKDDSRGVGRAERPSKTGRAAGLLDRGIRPVVRLRGVVPESAKPRLKRRA